jgi:membrane-associated phospholipid phosphatase
VVPALPYRDAWFAAADRMIGIDWPALHAWTWAHRFVAETLTLAYPLLLLQLLPALFVLAFLDGEATRRFLAANFVVMMATMACSVVLPAAGAMAWFHPALTPITPDSYPAQLELVRSGALRVIDTDHEVGLIQFPSYHAALAVLIGLAFSHTRWWIAASVWLVEGLIVASAPVMGGHHVVDVLAGVALAVVVQYLVERYPTASLAATDLDRALRAKPRLIRSAG